MRTKILLLCLLIAGSTQAADFKQGYISYSITSPTTVCVVEVNIGEQGEWGFSPRDTTRFEIPETVEYNGRQLTVTAIGNTESGWQQVFLTRVDNIILPKSITTIGDNAFRYSGVKSINLPDGIKALGDACFKDCRLEEIHLPDSLKEIGAEAFEGLPLKEIHFPKGLTTIKREAFQGCQNLTEIDLPESLQTLDGDVFSGCLNLRKVTTHSNLKSIRSGCFAYCSKLTTVVLGGKIEELSGFNGCSALESFTVPEGTLRVLSEAFAGCTSLKEIVLPNSVYEMGQRVFSNCSSLTEVTLPKAIKHIQMGMFSYCKSLKSLTIGENVKNIAGDAFEGCESLRHLTVRGRTPSSYASSTFSQDILDLFNEGELSVPADSKEAYAKADFWKNFKQVTEYDPGTLYQAVPLTIWQGGGRVSYNGQQFSEGESSLLVPEGEPFTLTFLPDEGKRVREVEQRYSGGTDYLGKNVKDNQLTISTIKPEGGIWVFFGVAQANLDIVQNEMGRVRILVDIDKTYGCRIIEEEGWQVHSITYNGEDITNKGGKENYIQTPVVKGDAVVRIALEQSQTGITKPEQNGMRVLGDAEGIVIENAKEGELINVYLLNGQLVRSFSSTGSKAHIALPSNAVYIIKTGTKTIKIPMIKK